MYRIDAWSQGDGALWASGSNGGAGGRPEGDGKEASRHEDEESPLDFEESDLDWVASY
ncbi:hypothetical protein HMI51_35915 [Corallococcus coralloides]|nr:hypothetical protein [Corallococcus coralloides]